MKDWKNWYDKAKKNIDATIQDFTITEFHDDSEKRIAFSAMGAAFLEVSIPPAKAGKTKRDKQILKDCKADIKNFSRQVKLLADGKTPNSEEYAIKLASQITGAIAQVIYIKYAYEPISVEFNYNAHQILNLIENKFALEELAVEFDRRRQEWAKKS